tara:strand:+ start:15876 stop:18788 length:2913 start_codon:yes stop_codon:yes gene_type:complete
MAKQTQLFPAEEMQEDIISMENVEAPTAEVNVENANSIFTPIAKEEPKESIEPFDVAVNGKIGGMFSKELGDVFKLSKDKVKQKDEAGEPKPVREFIQDEDSVVSAASQKDVELKSPILEQAAETTAETQERLKYINPTDTKIAETLINLSEPKRVELSSQPLTDFSAVNKKGETLIPDENGVIDVLKVTSNAYKKQINEAKRGEIEQAVTRQVADLIGVGEGKLKAAILDRRPGNIIQLEGMGAAETMLAARDLLITEASKLDVLAKAIQGGDDSAANLLAFKRQATLLANLQSNIKGSQTEIARALAQFNIPTREADADNLRNIDVNNILNDYGGENSIKQMVESYTSLKDGNKRMQYVSEIGKFKKFTNAMYEAWINIILSSPISHAKNIIGSTLTSLNYVVDTAGAATIGSIRRGITGQKNGANFGEVRAALFAAIANVNENWSLAAQAYKGEDTTLKGSKIDYERTRTRAFSAEGFEASGVFAQFANVVGNIFTLRRVPTKLLGFEDTFFKVSANRMALYKRAYREALIQGKNTDVETMSDFIADYVYNPPVDAIIEGEATAKYITLQSELGPTLKSVQTLARTPFVRWFVPFFKTPANAFKYATEHSPAGLLLKNMQDDIKAGGARSDMALAKMATGSAAMIATLGLIMEGRLTGGGPTDSDLKAIQYRQKWKPYSIKFGDRFVSIQGLEPFSTIMMIMGDIGDVMSTGLAKGEEIEELMAKGIASIGYALTNKTMMQGFANFIDTIRNPEYKGTKTFEQFISSAVPTVVSTINKGYVDPVLRDVRSTLDAIKARTPGLSKTLKPRRNLWGQKIINSGALGPDIISPFYTSLYDPHPVDDELWALRAKITKHPDALQFSNAPSGSPIELSDDQRDWYHKRAGELSLEKLNFLIVKNNKVWELQKKMKGKEWAIEKIRNEVRVARKRAEKELLIHPEYGKELMNQILQLKFDKQNEKIDRLRSMQ